MRHSSFAIVLFATISLVGCCSSKPAGLTLIKASDKAAVDAAMPTVGAIGMVDNVTTSDSVITINFKDTQDSHLYAVILRDGRDALESANGGDVAKAITGKTVRVTGKVVLYRGKPEIVISKPDQLVVLN